MNTTRNLPKITTHVLQEMKQKGEKIAMLTGYDYSMAKLLDEARIDVILVGDSASNVMAGHKTTLPITLDEMIYHASSVMRAIERALVIVDLPFGTYQGNSIEALNSAIRIMKESGANAIKMEGGEEILESVDRVLSAGIPVIGHLGLTPQSINKFGTYVVRATEQEEAEKLLDQDIVMQETLKRVEQNGIIFIDEVDKIIGRQSGGTSGPDVSREGVQRDLLPIVEGSSINTKYGIVKTDHILFIAAGAFHAAKPSDLIPEFQGRFPIRVELDSLTKSDFIRILTEPDNALVKQYTALLKTENVNLSFLEDAIDQVAEMSALVNQRTENIGARRLQTIMEKFLEEISFDAPDLEEKNITIDAHYIQEKLKDIIQDEDLSRYIL
mgnify:CR=1 FL=1